jgi:pimeloyl-ACP methyl ester carboxylesterase
MPSLQTGELNLYYEIHGEGVPLLLIHGLGSSTLDWEYQLGPLSRHFRIVTVDLRGHGKSGKPPGPYSVRLFAADTARLIRALGLAPVHVAGLSLGGMVAFQLALDAPDMVKSMIIINSGPELILRTFAQRTAFLQRKLIVRCLGMKQMAQFLAKILLPEPHQEPLQKTLIERWTENDKKAYLASINAIIGWSVADRLGTIHCPTLVISADQDYTPVSYKEGYVVKMPCAELVVIRNSRHLSPLDQPEQVNTAILKFLFYRQEAQLQH